MPDYERENISRKIISNSALSVTSSNVSQQPKL